MSILDIKNLTAGYGPITVLKDINMSIENDKITGIIGPNGVGKSTLLKSITGIADVKGGEILYDGSDISGMGADELIRQGIAYMPQGDRVFPDMSVYDNLRMGGYILDKDEFEENLQTVYDLYPVLEEKRKHKARSLSGGQQTMVSFGMALVNDPQLILLDEPSTGLAPNLVDKMFEQIEMLRDERIPFLIVEQSVRTLLNHCGYVYVIDQGTTMFDGEAHEIRERDDLMDMYLALEVE
jgi:branched-chain amino acid transport system ATP-binding protein